MYSIEYSNRYKKSYKLAIKRGLDVNILNNVVKTLAEGKKLDKNTKIMALRAICLMPFYK